jgi:ABC-type proline/glycine betaine transport system ATPase subunit
LIRKAVIFDNFIFFEGKRNRTLLFVGHVLSPELVLGEIITRMMDEGRRIKVGIVDFGAKVLSPAILLL